MHMVVAQPCERYHTFYYSHVRTTYKSRVSENDHVRHWLHLSTPNSRCCSLAWAVGELAMCVGKYMSVLSNTLVLAITFHRDVLQVGYSPSLSRSIVLVRCKLEPRDYCKCLCHMMTSS